MTAPGVHISFFDAGEAASRELPAIGPLHGVVLRGDRLIIERAEVAVPDAPGVAVTRWLEGVVELQRCTGETPGGRRRASMRISAPDGVYLHFGAVGEPAAAMRELGPFALVFIGAQTIEANGNVLASRLSRESGMWILTANADPHAVGAQRPDVGFRSTRTPYHEWMTVRPTLPPQNDPTQHPTASTAELSSEAAVTQPAPAPAPSQRVLKDSDLDLLERRARRLKEDEERAEATARDAAAARDATGRREATLRRAAVERDAAQAAAGQAADDAAPLRARLGGSLRAPGEMPTELRRVEASRVAARRWVTFIVVALLIGVSVFGALSIRGALSGTSRTVVGIGKAIKGTQFDYTVATVSRTSDVSAARARGVYLIVFVTATNRSSGPATLSPTAFRIVDSGGIQYPALSESDPVYQSAANPGSPLIWSTAYAVGQAVSTPVIFEIEPTLRGVQLIILEVPAVRVRLD